MNFFTDENIFEENNIKKRTKFVFSIVILLFFVAIASVFFASRNTNAISVIENQSTYTLSVGKMRGTIYDADFNKITNSDKKYAYAVVPDAKSLYDISKIYGNKYLEQFELGAPFTIYDETFYEFNNEYIDTFELNERYSDLASHIIGYLNYEKVGVSGVEKIFEDVLSRFSGEAKIRYTVNAQNAAIAVNEREVINTLSNSNGGVVLTIEKDLQEFCEETAEKYMNTGAVVISEVDTGKLRAVVSLPSFSQNDIERSLGEENSPFINRAFSAYTPGSVFKIITAAAALKSEIDTDTSYECIGYEGDFWCYNHTAHGEIKNMKDAISKSCNSYFVNLSKSLNEDILYQTAIDFGLGSEDILYPSFKTERGEIPDISDLMQENLKSQFSFGQGELTVTPIEASQIISAIANGGNFVSSKLIEGVVDENGSYIEKIQDGEKKKILNEAYASEIRSAMHLAASEGTAYISSNGNSINYAAKTGTAQTGKFLEYDEIVHFWYAGFYPYNNPKYSIIVLSDNTPESMGSPCDEVFSEIIDFLKDYN